ncbi:MAG: phospho-N-acetylmuramoyl-pentapeptide-transferase [Actinobacteria bacterium]|nr:phospho-N-acetylmuramoyl-pentapeptide-transferase [Actinomycetota bacterium]
MRAILAAAAVAFLASLVVTPLIIRYFRDRGFGQLIREDTTHHASKAGTPTMGGTAIVLAAVVGYVSARIFGVRFTPTGLLVLGTFVGMGFVGFLDDFIKIRMNRNLGLNKTAKFGGQALIAFAFAYLGPNFGGVERTFSFVGSFGPDELPLWIFYAWVFVMLAGTSNAVNLTDGLDGLAAGSSIQVLAAYVVIAFWQARNPGFYAVPEAEAFDIAVIAAATMAACAGFLWWNAPPAQVFMGDTGSLALGGLLAALAISTNTQFLLVTLGGIFVIETISVMAQVFFFRVFDQRVLRMAPLHHHFEILGWQETTVIVRFWILAGMGVAVGLGIFYTEFLAAGGAANG